MNKHTNKNNHPAFGNSEKRIITFHNKKMILDLKYHSRYQNFDVQHLLVLRTILKDTSLKLDAEQRSMVAKPNKHFP